MRHAWVIASVVLIGAGIAKFSADEFTSYVAQQFQLPIEHAGAIATGVSAVEVLIGLGLIPRRTRYVCRGAAFGLAVAFLAFHGVAYVNGDLIPACPCLGFRLSSDGRVAHSVGFALNAFMAAAVIPSGVAFGNSETPSTSGEARCAPS